MSNYIHLGTKLNKLTGFHPLINVSNYATSVDMDTGGNYVVSGNPSNKNARIFQKTEGGSDYWGEVGNLIVPGGNPDSFGFSVAINIPYVLVGAPTNSNGTGSVYIFQQVGSSWNFVKQLAPSYAGPTPIYPVGGASGMDVELTSDGNWAFVVSTFANNVYIYSVPGWTLNNTIFNKSPFCVSAQSNYAVIGYPCSKV